MRRANEKLVYVYIYDLKGQLRVCLVFLWFFTAHVTILCASIMEILVSREQCASISLDLKKIILKFRNEYHCKTVFG